MQFYSSVKFSDLFFHADMLAIYTDFHTDFQTVN